MEEKLLHLLRCPVTRSLLSLQVLSTATKKYDNTEIEVVHEGILYAEKDWFYPVINGIPRLLVEAFEEYAPFLKQHLPDYNSRAQKLKEQYGALINLVTKKNKRTKESFTQEWNLFNYEEDKTWDENTTGMLKRFLQETAETEESIKGKIIFDAGCGNGLLNQSVAASGATILGMDFSLSIERAYKQNKQPDAFFIQGDVQYPPVAFEAFDIVHSSGVLIATNNTELSFSCIEPCVKKGGKLSVWLYHPRKDFIHTTFNIIRKYTSRLPVKFQYYLYAATLFPASYIVKRWKGNKQNKREMMIDILDWFSPKFRWEHSHEEAESWYKKRNYISVQITATTMFGFNITGIKS